MGPIAVFLGINALAELKHNGNDRATRTLAVTGIVLGTLGCGVPILLLRWAYIQSTKGKEAIDEKRRVLTEIEEDRSRLAVLEIASAVRQAEEQFRNDDLDNNGAFDYWTKDVQGLRSFLGEDCSPTLLELVDADRSNEAETTNPRPFKGFWLYSIRSERGGVGTEFAFCVYPDIYGKWSRFTYVFDDEGKMLRKDNGGLRVEAWPGKADLSGWEEVSVGVHEDSQRPAPNEDDR